MVAQPCPLCLANGCPPGKLIPLDFNPYSRLYVCDTCECRVNIETLSAPAEALPDLALRTAALTGTPGRDARALLALARLERGPA